MPTSTPVTNQISHSPAEREAQADPEPEPIPRLQGSAGQVSFRLCRERAPICVTRGYSAFGEHLNEVISVSDRLACYDTATPQAVKSKSSVSAVGASSTISNQGQVVDMLAAGEFKIGREIKDHLPRMLKLRNLPKRPEAIRRLVELG